MTGHIVLRRLRHEENIVDPDLGANTEYTHATDSGNQDHP
jgi:hypothetical protein